MHALAQYLWSASWAHPPEAAARETLLVHGGSIRMRIENAQTDHYRLLGRNAWLHVTRDPHDEVAASLPVTDPLSDRATPIEALPAGAYRVAVVLGEWWEMDQRLHLGSASVTLAAGEDRDVLLRLSDPPAPAREATLAGTITSPTFERDAAVIVRLHEVATYSQGRADREISIDAMARIDPRGRNWRFAAPDLKVGRYQVKLWPFLLSTIADLPDEGNPAVNIAVPALAEVNMQARDACTGVTPEVHEILWGPTTPIAGMVNFVVELSETGEYELTFPDFAPPRYRAVPPRSVIVKPGELADVVVDLERP